MRKLFILLVAISFSTSLFSQVDSYENPPEKRNSITIGILEGGGSLIGADMEFLLS